MASTAAAVPSRQQVLRLYRGLLREINRQVTPITNNGLWRENIVSQFHTNKNLQDPRKVIHFYR